MNTTSNTWRSEHWEKYVPFELALSLDNFEHDDKAPPSLQMAVDEAQYIIDLHYECGTTPNEMMTSECADERKAARKTIRECRAFIKKYQSRTSPKIR
jgi:hypothetical protein